jgi:methylenetetrahydrofolate reductase (NADPH)
MDLADFAVTQFFFEAEDYLRLVDQLSARGMEKPVVPGIMPITSLGSVPRMAQMGAAVPAGMIERLEAAGSAEAVRQAGIEMATELCEKLLAEGAPGLHFYTLNRSVATREIYASLGLPTVTSRPVG